MAMKAFRAAAAILLSACTAFSFTACGENTATAMTVDGMDIRAGVYLYYATTAYSDAIELAKNDGAEFEEATETADYKKVLKDSVLDGVDAQEWIKNKAEEYCRTFVAVEKDFERLGLSLTGDELASINNTVATSMNYYADFFSKTGIGEQSVKDIVTNSYKQEALWEAYYGEGGSVGIEDKTLYDYFVDNHFRIKYLTMPLKDGEGNMLKSDGKAEIEKMADDYMRRLGKKQSKEADLMNEMDFLIDEHNHYVTSLSEAAVTTTDENGNQVTTATTAKVTTDKNGSTGTTAPETETGTETTTTLAAEETETTAETTGTAETAETKESDETKDSEETTEPGEEPDEDVTAETTTVTADTETTETTTATVDGLGYSTANERVLVVSTAPKEEPKPGETTTEPTYIPCEKVYNWAVDPNTKYLKPEFIKDDENYYIAVKMDLNDRMTDTDQWTQSAKESVRSELYHEEFLTMLQDMGKELSGQRNERAFRRYKVLDIDVIGFQNAAYQSYMSQYGYSG